MPLLKDLIPTAKGDLKIVVGMRSILDGFEEGELNNEGCILHLALSKAVDAAEAGVQEIERLETSLAQKTARCLELEANHAAALKAIEKYQQSLEASKDPTRHA